MQFRIPRRVVAASATAVAALVLTACGNDGSTTTGAAPSAAAQQQRFNTADVNFATEMIPHHRQAVEMAAIATERATSPQVKALAERIKGAQDPEIATMSGWLRAWGKPVPAAATGPMDHSMHAPGMTGLMTAEEMTDLARESGAEFDRMFLTLMVRHHEGAIEMARTEQANGENAAAKEMAVDIEKAQTAEIAEMKGLLAKG